MSGGVIYISSRLAAVLADYVDGKDLMGTIIKSVVETIFRNEVFSLHTVGKGDWRKHKDQYN